MRNYKHFFSIPISKFLSKKGHNPSFSAIELLKYIGPGLLVTVGFIDPGNWASNITAGAEYGYTLLWIVSLSTIMLIILQHNAAHLGIVTGLCLSEAASFYISKFFSRSILSTAIVASISTSLAELLGGAIALNMLFEIPITIGSLLMAVIVLFLIITNTYKRIESIIIGFVSIIGLSFILELSKTSVDWNNTLISSICPKIPEGSIPLIMSILGAVVMPHNIFLHSEIIQSRQFQLKNEEIIKKQLKFEFADTLLSMGIGWAINSAMIILAASTFFINDIKINELSQAQITLKPLLGNSASIIFAIALLFSGLSSSITSGIAGGTIFAGIFGEPFDIKDRHSKTGVIISILAAFVIIIFISNPMKVLILSQVVLSIQLPITIVLLIFLTSSEKVMGKYKNSKFTNILLITIGLVVIFLNFLLFINTIRQFF